MADAIGAIVAFIIVYGIPYIIYRKEEHKRLENLYKPKNNDHSTDEWRR